MSGLLAFGAAALATGSLLGWLLRGSLAAWHDQPNHRSLHAVPVPRIGGLAIHAGWLAAFAAVAAWSAGRGDWPGPGGWAVPAGFAAVLAVSLLDDRRSVGPLPRLLVHAAAAAALVAAFGPQALRPAMQAWGVVAAAAAVVVLAALWAMNLYNFMDGADGLAGGMTLFGFGTYALLAAPTAPTLAVAAASVAGAGAGFLRHNFPPARVFMGDAGSVPLGFLAAALGLAGIAQGVWGWWLPPLAFLPFAADATFTLARRALRGERVWQAHREHGYQKLILLGWSHRRCALAWYGAMAACSAAAVALSEMAVPVQWTGLAVMTALALVALSAIEVAWRRRASNPT